jgi:hypothetical protein
MPNKERGEMRLVAGDQTYVLRMTTNAACDLEEFTGKSLPKLIDEVNGGSVRAIRAFLWAALQEHHSKTIKTIKEVGKLIDEAGGLEGVMEQLQRFAALNAAGGDQDGNPPTAQVGEKSPGAPSGLSVGATA